MSAIVSKLALMIAGEAARRWFPKAKPAVDTSKGVKGLLTSKTFWGSVITTVAGALPWLPVPDSAATSIGQAVALLVGAGITIYGRVKADKPIAR